MRLIFILGAMNIGTYWNSPKSSRTGQKVSTFGLKIVVSKAKDTTLRNLFSRINRKKTDFKPTGRW